MKCAHCGASKAKLTWSLQACADGGKERKKRLCGPCDVECNRLVLEFFNDKNAAKKIAKYKAAQ